MDLMLATRIDNSDKAAANWLEETEAAKMKTNQDCPMPDTEDMKLTEELQRLAEKEAAKSLCRNGSCKKY